MPELRLYIAQRLSAAILAPLVLLHLGVMIYAIQGGLSAEEILARTRGSLAWGVIYGAFVIAAAVHASIGLRNILAEWGGLRDPWLGYLSWAFLAVLAIAGLRAVAAVVIA
jgi:fumarate reductase subunit C